MILLDTNVISELLRPAPVRSVVTWLAAQNGPDVYLSAVSEAELRLGVALLPAGCRSDRLTDAIDAIFSEDFRDRILPFDGSAARAYASIVAERRTAGRPISQFDAQIAAIASSRSATVATRNTRDFEGCRIDLLDPWGET